MAYDMEKEWGKAYVGSGLAYPSEYVIRIFKGKYSRLNLDKDSFKGKKICDVGCGDGRNIVLLSKCGFDTSAVEISQNIVDQVKANMDSIGIKTDARVGSNDDVPFDDEQFDYLLSWNACYYLGAAKDFGAHVKEFARVLKPEGFLVMSIPKKTCFIYEKSELALPGYQIIRNDPYEVRNGAILRMFEDEQEIKREFSKYFEDFIFGSIHDDCFGFDYHWHLVVCRRNHEKY